MYTPLLFYIRISLFLGILFLFWWGISLWQNETNCRSIKPNEIHWTHIYTCEYDDIYNSWRLANYCARDGSTSTWPEYDWCTFGNVKLKCHICECQDWKWINGICKKEDAKKDTWSTQSTQTTVVWTNTWSNTWWSTWSNNTENQENDPCPWTILDSQWNCCKKMYYDLSLKANVCCEGILLSTNVPFIGQCIVYRKKSDPQQPVAWLVVDETTAFPRLMGWLSRILVSIILLVGFIGILIGGVMISASGGAEEGATKGRKIIGNVISALALLGASGVILRLINPNFFW